MGASKLAALLAGAACAGVSAEHPYADTHKGPVLGVDRGSTTTWWGIPFAEKPLGDLRFRAPVEVQKNWTEPLQATKPPPLCKQIGLSRGLMLGNEDCLYLNVHAPKQPQGLRPVMVWIYGGGYVFGDSHEFGLYDGMHLSERHDVVVVSMNYRLELLGFMALDALRAEDPNNSTGNYALQDQQAALRWVQRNIKNFGGDPDRVTVFGESAGAFSVMWHLVSPTSKGLFKAAIMESGTSEVNWFFQPYHLASAQSEFIAANFGCPASMGGPAQLACLRGIRADHFEIGLANIVKDAVLIDVGIEPKDRPPTHSPLWPGLPFGPAIDGSNHGLLDVPITLVRRGQFNRVPLILGANENGGTIFEPVMPFIVPKALWPASLTPFHYTFKKALNTLFGSNASRVMAEYSNEEFKSARWPDDARISRIIRDLVFQCPNRALARAWSDAGLPTYLYVFRWNFGLWDKLLKLGDFHAGELPFVFRNALWLLKAVAPGKDPWLMADIMSCNWASFAYSHDPNGGNDESAWPPNCANVHRKFSSWPKFHKDEAYYYSLEEQPKLQPILGDNKYPDDLFPRDTKCDLWDELAPHLPWSGESVFEAAPQPAETPVVV